MQLDSLPDLYQPPSHDARETNRGNLSKGIKTLKFWIFFSNKYLRSPITNFAT